MPMPVEALPWGSTSTISTDLPQAASAVARLMAGVVLPSPPFWLAIARTRARFGAEIAGLGSCWLTSDMLQAKDRARRVRGADLAHDRHIPPFADPGQFFIHSLPLQK